MSGKRLGENSQLRVVERRRTGECESGLGEGPIDFTAMPEIGDFRPELGVSRNVPGLEKLGQGLRYSNECEGCGGD